MPHHGLPVWHDRRMTTHHTSPGTPPRFLSSGVVVVRQANNDWRLLILRAYGKWDFPKGMVEPDETPLQGAIRETAEEASITDLDFRWGEIYFETAPYNQGSKVARYYLAETKQEHITLPVSPELGHPEHDEWRWASFDDAERLLPPRLQPVLAWVKKELSTT
jgi:8-oxo-dGTP pyrophosphatase MutT (NUDIX family)